MSHKDRRKAKRYLLKLPIRFLIYAPSLPEKISPSLDAQLYDLSELGMRILTNHVRSEDMHILSPNLTTSEQCLLKIEIPQEKEVLTLQGKVIWYDRNSGDEPFSFQVGIEFLDSSPDLKGKIKALMQQKGTLEEAP